MLTFTAFFVTVFTVIKRFCGKIVSLFWHQAELIEEPREVKNLHCKQDARCMYTTSSISSTVDSRIKSLHLSEAERAAGISVLFHHVLECDFSGLEYTNADHDITIKIPKGAVAEGETIHFEIAVTTPYGGSFIFPENTQPISPILWLCISEENYVLKKPFEIILPHFLSGLTKEKARFHSVNFAKASHTNRHPDGQSYDFHQCACNTEIMFWSSENKSYGTFKANHCCFYCLLANCTHESMLDAGYCLARIESVLSPQQKYEVYFCATYFLPTCLRALEEQFPLKDGHKIVRYVMFRFASKDTDPCIELVIPHEHDCIIAVEPRTAKIRASDIHFLSASLDTMRLRHETRVYPPRLKITIILKLFGNIQLPFKFVGSTDDSSLSVDLVFTSGYSSLSSSSSSPSIRSSRVEYKKPKFREMFKLLIPLATYWKTIGTLLGIPKEELDRIKKDEIGSIDCLSVILSEWLAQFDPLPTWDAVADAVEFVDQSMANQIRSRYIGTMTPEVIGRTSIFPSAHFREAKERASVPFLCHTILEFDHKGGEYTNADHEITLRIPEGAVAAGETIHLEFSVAMYGPFKFPPNMLPISPIVWLCPMEEIDLKKPFEIELPHIHKGLNRNDIQRLQVCFTKAGHTGLLDSDGRKYYKFEELKTEIQTSFQSKSYQNYGILRISHFCYLCLSEQKNPEVAMNADYCLARVTVKYSPYQKQLRHVFHFYAMFDLPTCRKALEENLTKHIEHYSKLEYTTFRFQCDDKQEGTQQPQMYLRVVNPEPSERYESFLSPVPAEITASEIDFRDKEFEVMKERQEQGLYPPKAMMTILSEPTKNIGFPLRFEGCTKDSKLNEDLVLPLGVQSIPFPGDISINTAQDFRQPHEVQFATGQERTEPAGPMFSVDMSVDRFKIFLRNEGLMDKDCSKLIDNGIGAKIFADMTEDDIKDPELGLSFGAKKVIRKILNKFKSGEYSNATSQPIARTTSSNSGSYLNPKQLTVVLNELFEARDKWYNIGLKIKVDPTQLESIADKCRSNPEDCLREVLLIFLRNANPKPTWTLLVDALKSEIVGHGQLAETIHENFIGNF